MASAKLDLPRVIYKYLKSLRYIKNASPQTLRSYINDLNQYLQPLSLGKFSIKASDTSIQFQIGTTFKAHQRPTLAGPFLEMVDIEPEEIGDITEVLISLFKQAQVQWMDVAPASRHRKFSALKSFFRYLFEHKFTSVDLRHQVILPSIANKLPNVISVDEVLACIRNLETRAPKTSEEVKKIWATRSLFALLYGGGLRVSEACGLEWQNVDWSQRHVEVSGKGGKPRRIPCPEFTFVALRGLQPFTEACAFVFGDRPLNSRVAYGWVRRLGILSALTAPLHPHALRHSYATHLLQGGTDLRILQDLLGHSSLTSTQRYTHLSVENLLATLESHHPLAKRESST